MSAFFQFRQVARCQIPLDDVLTLPFSVEKNLALECFSEFSGAKGYLQVRFPDFLPIFSLFGSFD